MKNKTNFLIKIKKVFIITICWTFFSSFAFITEYFFVYDLIKLKRLSGSYDFLLDFIGTVILGVFGGVIGGYLLVFKMNNKYRKKSFAFGIINSGLLFIISYLTLAVVGLFVMDLIYFVFQTNFLEAITKSIDNVIFNINTPSFFISMCVGGFLVTSTQFMLQVNDKFGQGILWKFITGKYYNPTEEVRIFMFLDLKSSTTLAEKIGSKKYFEFLREVYQDITDPILNCQGEIYQYVGDEVVISWPVDKGILDNNCVQCYFEIEHILKDRMEYYKNNYGLLPAFKAGVHCGEVTVGEIGVIKKDIVYSGDTLNTTSRIEGECNNYGVNFLLSSALLQRLQIDVRFNRIPIGEIQLKGKIEKIGLHSLQQA